MPIEFASLSAQKLLELPSQQTVFFFPVGILEDHGPHLPLGLAASEATRLCQLTATRLEADLPGWIGVIMPSCPFGIEGNTTFLSLPVRSHVLRDWLVDACRGLARHDFRHFVCFTGHLGPRQLTAIEEAGKIVSGRFFLRKRKAIRPYLISASSALVSGADARKSPLWPDAREHGGKRDTSIALAITPELVAPTFPALGKLAPPADSFWKRAWKRQRREVRGYWGAAPADASAGWGEQLLNDQVRDLFPQLRAVWTGGANPATLFKSWYSIFPPNKSFFRAWLLAFGLGLLMLFWVYLAILGIASS